MPLVANIEHDHPSDISRYEDPQIVRRPGTSFQQRMFLIADRYDLATHQESVLIRPTDAPYLFKMRDLKRRFELEQCVQVA